MRGNWNYPTAVKFGAGRVKELGAVCKAAGIQRPLLVTDPGLAKLAMIRAALDLLKAEGLPVELFHDLKPNPVGKNVADGVAAFKAGRHDGVVAFGGGSALDAGKAIAFVSHQTRPLWDFEDVGDWWTRADPAAIRPTVAVPTTSGTGSEVGRVAVIVREETHEKKLIFHPRIQPVAVIEDPELTVGLPKSITAATGMDALAHCLEAYCAPGFHPMAEGVALEGMRLIKDSLVLACEQPANLEGRGKMMAAATMGATAFQKGLGAVHSLSHPLGALYDSHHGLLNGVLMPYVLDFNRDAIERKMRRLARHLALRRQSTDGVIAWLLELRRAVGIPHTLPAIGIGAERMEEVIAQAVPDPSTPSNPKPIDAAGFRRIFRAAVDGSIA
ncbi:MAG: iron-containing alcohol dehydrogenase [Alphaproteobacteria bacterium]|nr:iron-containing alcohol dehydrogenase [Alphaproteobacteria bacterium]